MTRKTVFCAFCLLLAHAAAAGLPGDVTLDPAFGGLSFDSPVGVRQAGDGSDRKFIIERPGRIRIVNAGGTLNPAPFLDISAITSTSSERGLLGLAFHPNFASNGRVYLYHSASGLGGITTGDSVIAEYTVSIVDPNLLDPGSRRVVMVIPQDFNNHNGGDLHFGADGYLYIGMGDGGSGNDPCNRGQTLDPSTLAGGSCRGEKSAWLLGKMLRIDVDTTTPAGGNNLCAANGDGSAEYAVPPANPYFGDSDRCGEVWAYGLRNPYRFSFDRDSGDLWIGDVGQNTWEEVDLVPADNPGGANLGWKICEGNFLRGSTVSPCNLVNHHAPVLDYRNGLNSTCSVIGGYRYRGPVVSLQGIYVFGDYCSGEIWFAEESAPGVWSEQSFGFLSGFFGDLTGFGEDQAGNLYLTRGGGEVLVFNGDTEVTFQVGGSVSGLAGTGLVLQNNAGDDLVIDQNGPFAFATALPDQSTYQVTVLDQPLNPLQNCQVNAGSGQIDGADVNSVDVQCVTLDDEIFDDRFQQP